MKPMQTHLFNGEAATQEAAETAARAALETLIAANPDVIVYGTSILSIQVNEDAEPEEWAALLTVVRSPA
jgi:hypothetical protein